MNILITGGFGFIGRQVCYDLLRLGHTLKVIDNLAPYNEEDNWNGVSVQKSLNLGYLKKCFIKELSQEIENVESIAIYGLEDEYDFIIHLAAHAGVIPSFNTPINYFENNLIDTVVLAEACKKLKRLKGFIFASSSSVNATPLSPYAISKMAASKFLETYFHTYMPQVTLDILEYYTVYGPWMRPDLFIPKAVKAIESGSKVTLRNMGRNLRHFTYVEDIAAVTEKCVSTYEKRSGINTYRVGALTSVSNYVVLDYILRSLSKSLDIEDYTTYTLHHVEDGFAIKEPTENRLSDFEHAKCLKELGFAPTMSIGLGIQLTVNQLIGSVVKA
jgi:nucleoside-diphosphate-sugar epimerase